MIELARANPIFRATVEKVVRGDPEALLLVEFAGEAMRKTACALHVLNELIGDLGFGWDREAQIRRGGRGARSGAGRRSWPRCANPA